MNKLFTKVAALSVGLAMAIGVGVGLGAKTALSVKAAATDTTQFQLINSTDDLVAGKSYIITNGTSGTVKAISTADNSNNRKTTEVTVSSNKITRGSSVMSFTLGGSSGAWTFATENYEGTAGYLASAASGNNNYLRVISTAGTATISFSSNEAVINIGPHSTRKQIRYNTSNLFACYSSGQSAVYLWKEVEAKTLSSISITTPPTTTTYYAGEFFDPTGMVVTATYSDASTATVTPTSYTPSLLTALTTSDTGVTVSYTEGGVTKTTTQSITVNPARTMTSIALHGTISKTSYYVGDSWDLTGLDIQVNWSDGDPTYVDLEDASVAYECDPATATSESVTSFDIQVLYDEFDETFTVSGITVAEHPFADVLDESVIGAQSATYTSGWAEISGITDYTGATYMMRTMKPSSSDYAMSTNANGYFVATSCPSNAKVKSISFSFLTSGKNLAIYGSNTAYAAGTAPSATSLGTVNGTGEAVSFDFSELENSYKYVAFKGTGSSTVVGTITVEYESVSPVMEYTEGGTTANLTVVNGSTNTVTFNANNFASVTVDLFSNTPSNANSTKANLAYSVSGTVVTVTATGKAVGDETFTISATGCSNTLTLNVTVQDSTTFDSLVITTATTATVFNEGDAFAVTGIVVTANYTIGGSPSTTVFSAANSNLNQLTYTVGGSPISLGDSLSGTGSLSVVISYTDLTTSTTRSASAYNITVNAYVAHTYTKVTSAPHDWRGTYLLVFEDNTDAYIFNSSLETPDATSNYVTGTISSNTITGSQTIDSVAIKIERNTIDDISYYHVKLANNKYLNGTKKAMNCQTTATVGNAATLSVGDDCLVINSNIVRFNNSSGQTRFRFYGSETTTMDNCSLYKMDVTTAINTEVSNYATSFLTNVTCSGSGSIVNDGWSDMSTAFAALSVDAQGILANTVGDDSGAGVAGAVGRYDEIIIKHSADHADFMSRFVTGGISDGLSIRSYFGGIFGQNENTALIIIIVSVLSAAAVGGYFFLRRRKEK